ncbi:MAG: hypothetical protein M1132_05180 [Chloroflexi bacterium]|nr:hypothetical protein [Chloroflexota bacterium]
MSLAAGLGVAIPPLLLELAYLVHLPWGTVPLVIYLAICALVLMVPLFKGWRPSLNSARPSWHGLVFLWLIGLVLLLRLYVIRDLPVGLWGDSYQHTMIAQLLVDHGGLFSSWQPYAQLATFTYHFGFHANVAFFHWLTGIPTTQGLLYVGQILNAATVPLAFLLTTRLTTNRVAGLWAALLTGFFNTQPAFYTNWGRYPQLAGQVVLPVVLLTWMGALGRSRIEWRLVTLAALMTASLALTHYIVMIFAVLFISAYLVALWVREPTWRTVRRVGTIASAVSGIAFLLVLPWFLNTLNGFLGRNIAGFINGAVGADRIAGYSALPSSVPFYLRGEILALAVIGLMAALARRDWQVVLLAVWSQLLVLTAIPQVFGLPGAGIVDSFTAYIALYLTVIPLSAYPLGLAQGALEHWHCQFQRVGIAAMMLASIWGATLQQGKVDPSYQLFTQSDARAMEWIRTQTPPKARFLVNSFPAYGGTLIAGTDGGWWIPLLTQRETNLPPLTYGSERGEPDGLYSWINAFAVTLRGRPLTDPRPVSINLTDPAVLEALRESHFTYVYSGAHQTPGPDTADRFDTAALQASPSFRQVYSSDGVEIFQIVGGDQP